MSRHANIERLHQLITARKDELLEHEQHMLASVNHWMQHPHPSCKYHSIHVEKPLTFISGELARRARADAGIE